MATATELLRQGNKQEIWRKYCGFLDMGIGEFMAVQRRLLEEQLPRLAACELGRSIMKGAAPRTLTEFRATAPFTTYKDYAAWLLSRNEAVLPEKPFVWAHTSGRSGEYDLKWVPYTRKMYELMGETALCGFILSAAKKRGDVVLREGMKFVHTLALPPYASGYLIPSLLEQFNFTCFPPLEKAMKMEFQERIREAFASALSEGLDYFFGITSILLKIGENFGRMGSTKGSAAKMLLRPKAFFRIVKALLKSRLQGRALMPKDIWKVNGAMCGGMDTSILKEKVAESWGVDPFEGYVSTECGICAMQTWSHEAFTFMPHISFWEFISEKDYRTLMSNPSYIPQSYTMDEVEPGKEYVLVGTNYHGGVMIRYIVGDLVMVVSLEDSKTGVRLPQISFVSRIDGLIDIAGFTRMTEKTIWQAIENSGIPYEEWTVRKESHGREPILHLYLELKDEVGTADAIAEKIHACLKQLDEHYRNMEEMIALKPLTVSLLSKGTFIRYYEERQAAGADLAHLKPPHVNAPDKVVENLLRMSAWKI
jgi:hypothetical protein